MTQQQTRHLSLGETAAHHMRRLRLENRVSQQQLANWVSHGLPPGQRWNRDIVAARERPDRPTPLTIDELAALATAFGVPLWDFLLPYTGPCLACGHNAPEVEHLVAIGPQRFGLEAFTSYLLGLPSDVFTFRATLEEKVRQERAIHFFRSEIETTAAVARVLEQPPADTGPVYPFVPMLLQRPDHSAPALEADTLANRYIGEATLSAEFEPPELKGWLHINEQGELVFQDFLRQAEPEATARIEDAFRRMNRDWPGPKKRTTKTKTPPPPAPHTILAQQLAAALAATEEQEAKVDNHGKH